MADQQRRKDLVRDYRETRQQAGVYRLVNTANGRILVGSALNLASVANKLQFARTSNTVIDYRLKDDIAQYGAAVFELEVLETVAPAADQSDAQVRDDLKVLEGLWRDRQDASLLY